MSIRDEILAEITRIKAAKEGIGTKLAEMGLVSSGNTPFILDHSEAELGADEGCSIGIQTVNGVEWSDGKTEAIVADDNHYLEEGHIIFKLLTEENATNATYFTIPGLSESKTYKIKLCIEDGSEEHVKLITRGTNGATYPLSDFLAMPDQATICTGINEIMITFDNCPDYSNVIYIEEQGAEITIDTCNNALNGVTVYDDSSESGVNSTTVKAGYHKNYAHGLEIGGDTAELEAQVAALQQEIADIETELKTL